MPESAQPTPSRRVPTLDWMRGVVMVLMAIDHSSGAFNAGRLVTDGVFLYEAGTPLPAAQFLTRWITHLCAPTFVFLAGTALAMSLSRRLESGESGWSIDRHLLLRGAIIAGLEIVPSYFWMPPGRYLLQVLYAIGTSFILMVPLRRLPLSAVVAVAAAILLGGELAVGLSAWGPPDRTPLLAQLLLVAGPRGPLIIAYPTLPWLAIMLLGWAFGLRVRSGTSSLEPGVLLRGGAVMLAFYAVVRGVNGYGNMALFRDDPSLVQWLHVSKYPPSLAFVTLELGVMALCLAGLAQLARARTTGPDLAVLTALGRTPMFFYLLHIPLLSVTAMALGLHEKLGLGATYGFAALVVIALYPACRWYARYKAAHPEGWPRYV